MRFSPFDYLRRKVAEAFLGGVTDALQAITPENETLPDLDALRELLTAPKQLMAPKEDEPKRSKK